MSPICLSVTSVHKSNWAGLYQSSEFQQGSASPIPEPQPRWGGAVEAHSVRTQPHVHTTTVYMCTSPPRSRRYTDLHMLQLTEEG